MNASTDSSPKLALTSVRIGLAIAAAMAADGVQVLLGPLGWAFFDEIIDVATMILTCYLIGFHPLLLPTFIVELIPIVDMLPTWTGCVALVVILKRKQHQGGASQPPVSKPQDIIDV